MSQNQSLTAPSRNKMTDVLQKFTLFRFPMANSFSPVIHRTFGQQFGLSIQYTQTEVAPSALKEAIFRFRQDGGIGANVTMPHKEEAFQLCEKVTERAACAQSVNTLFWQDDVLWGDTTDGGGFITDITQNLQLSFRNKTVCILGAGGAASGILGAILQEQPKAVSIYNRNTKRAIALQARFKNAPIDVVQLEELNSVATAPDWIINTTPFSATQLLVPLKPHLMKNTFVYELAYPKEGELSLFSRWALENGAKGAFDGLGMLVEQAALSFSIWQKGLFPATHSVIKTLRG